MTGVAHQPLSSSSRWQTMEFCNEGRPLYCYNAGLTATQVLSQPTPPGLRPLHRGKHSVVPSLIVRAPFSQVFHGHPTHREHRRPPRQESLRRRHQLILGNPGFPAPPLRRTVLAGIAGRQLLRGPQGEADTPRALSPRSRPSAWPPRRLMLQVPTYTLSWQCHIMHCPSCWFALSYTPTAFTDQCPLQVCRHLQSRRLRPQP